MVDTDAPGWAAIDAALSRLYPNVTPAHFGTLHRWKLGGPDPLDGISFYPRDDHWHVVTYGMSDLYAKDGDDPENSGWGFEFTFRVARAPGDDEPPMWAASVLQNLARYVYRSGNPFAPGHFLDLNGPIRLNAPETAIRAAAFAEDPELPPIDTPHGRVAFLQLVGLTLDEGAVVERWDTGRLLTALQTRLPLLVTDLTRDSMLTDPEIAAAVEAGIGRDGSSTGALFVEEAGWELGPDGTTVRVGASAAERIGRALTGRLRFGRGLAVVAAESEIRLRPGDQAAVTGLSDGVLEVTLPPEGVDGLTAVLRPVAGTYPVAAVPGLTVEVVRSQIRDPEGAFIREVG